MANPQPYSVPSPAPYQRVFDFSDYEANYPKAAVPGTTLDIEFNAVQVAINQTQASLAALQRDDGALANGTVGADQLDPDIYATLAAGWNPRGLWLARTSYNVGDAVNAQGIVWVSMFDHVSGDYFQSDRLLVPTPWMPFMMPIAATAIPINIIPGVPAGNVQDALEWLVDQVTTLQLKVATLEGTP